MTMIPWRSAVLAVVVVTAGCHHAPPSTGPRNLRSAAECAPVIAQVLADTALRATLRAAAPTVWLPPMPAPERARGQTAQVRAPIDEHGRIRGTVSVVGMPDADYALEIRRAVTKIKWQPAVREGCWVPGWGYLTYTF
jgi:hypothetical protein